MSYQVSNTVIRNTNSLKENSNTVIRNTKRVYVQGIADYYTRKFNAPGSRLFFLKCGWKLSQDTMACIYERATSKCSGTDALKYFIKACKSEMSS